MIFDKFLNMAVNNPIEAESQGLDWLGNTLNLFQQSSSGETITPKNSLNIGRVYACANYRANAIAKMPFHVYKTTKDGNVRQTNAISNLLENRPNPYMSPFRFKHTLSTHVDLFGNAFIWIETKLGTPINLWVLNPWETQIQKNLDGTIVYNTSINGKPYTFLNEEIIHLKELTTDGITGKSKIDVLREDLGNTLSASKLVGNFFKNGSFNGGILESDQTIKKESKDVIKSQWQELNAGIDKAGSIAVIDMGLHYKELNTMKLADQQFLENVKLTKEQIAEVFQVPPTILGDLSRGTFNNTEQMQLSWFMNTMQPIVTEWEQEFSYKLFAGYQRQQGYFIEANMSAVLRADDKTRAEYYTSMYNLAAMNSNEIRHKEGMGSIGPAGDVYRVDLNHVNVEIADDYQLSRAGSNTDNKLKKENKEGKDGEE